MDGPPTITDTAPIINIMPTTSTTVRTSPKTNIPIATAVTGSSAPRIAVGVEPIYCIAPVVQRNETAVGKIANPATHPHNNHGFPPPPPGHGKGTEKHSNLATNRITPKTRTQKVTVSVATLSRLVLFIPTI